MNDINNKIEEIDKLLNDNILLDNYIKDIENRYIDIPPNLDNSLIQYFNKNSINIKKFEKKEKNIFLENSIKIFKIAACTIFALVIWNVSLTKPIIPEKQNNDTHTQISASIDNTMKNINEFLLTPIKLERNDK